MKILDLVGFHWETLSKISMRVEIVRPGAYHFFFVSDLRWMNVRGFRKYSIKFESPADQGRRPASGEL